MRELLPNFLYEESPVLDAVIKALEEEFEAFKQYVEERVLGWYIETATGEALNRIGLLAGEPRKGRTDPEYRVAIVAKINSLSGTQQVIQDVARTMSGEYTWVEDATPGKFWIHVLYNSLKVPLPHFFKMINHVKVAGTVPQLDLRALLKDTHVSSEYCEVRSAVQLADTVFLSEQPVPTVGSTDEALGIEDSVLLGEMETHVLKTTHYWDLDRWDLMAWM